MPMLVVRAPISLAEVQRMAAEQFGDFVKAVVDVDVRPSQGNRSRGVDDRDRRRRIEAVVRRLIGL